MGLSGRALLLGGSRVGPIASSAIVGLAYLTAKGHVRPMYLGVGVGVSVLSVPGILVYNDMKTNKIAAVVKRANLEERWKEEFKVTNLREKDFKVYPGDRVEVEQIGKCSEEELDVHLFATVKLPKYAWQLWVSKDDPLDVLVWKEKKSNKMMV